MSCWYFNKGTALSPDLGVNQPLKAGGESRSLLGQCHSLAAASDKQAIQ